MSIIDFNSYELDQTIDERIRQSNDIRNEWGTHIFDDEGRLQNNEDFPLDRYTLLGIVQYQQEQITDLTIYRELTTLCIDKLLDRVTVLENEMIDKDLRISKLEKDNAKYFKAFNSDISSLDIRIEGLEKEVEKL